MRIALVISSLAGGGAERNASIMANYWAARGHQVTVITLAAATTDFYKLHKAVDRVGLGLLSPSANWVASWLNTGRRVHRLRQAIQAARPDIIISFVDAMNLLTLMAKFGLGVPVIVMEQINPAAHPLGPAQSRWRRWLYPRAQAIVVLSAATIEWACQFVPRHRIHVLPNLVEKAAPESNAPASPLPTGRIMVAMGRLTGQKGFDLLLTAFSRCAAKHAGWSLVIMGEGDERRRLDEMAAELGVAGRVLFTGLVKNPVAILSRADLFVLSSRYEGFPLALLEAMACGLPVISFDCPTGPREIIRDGVDGLLVTPQNIVALAETMDHLMTDEQYRRRLAYRAGEVIERFGVETVMPMWDALVAGLLAKKSE
ncbi:MAG: glycosyltransferase family 4 protein [Acidobacteria bacterium]|nr:glycosyltransferase family 4 protein [Acidobacteriota bacterium]MBI3656812.1 glycosyltransferase family 4 protein [Acidobacteriota bacterium]